MASAKVELEATDEAIELNAAKLQNDALKELIASLKYFQKANTDDALNQRNLWKNCSKGVYNERLLNTYD